MCKYTARISDKHVVGRIGGFRLFFCAQEVRQTDLGWVRLCWAMVIVLELRFFLGAAVLD